MNITTQQAERFWSRVHKTDECWEWTGARIQNGYGQMRFDGVTRYTHRIAYELTHGSIPKSLSILHGCDNKICCNPAHLRAGTVKDNAQDAIERGQMYCKLTADQVREIRRLRRAGVRRTDVARMFDVCERTVYEICHYDSRKSVKDEA